MAVAVDAEITDADLAFVCSFIYGRAAITLDEGKAYLIKARLEPVARRRGFDSLPSMIVTLRKVGSGQDSLAEEVVDALTTNETSFFRDFKPFEVLRKDVMPSLLERCDGKLNIWCAASSSGQEPFSIALLLRQHFPQLNDWKITFMASDVSNMMLDRCKEGLFNKLEVNRGLPAPMLVKHFTEEQHGWRISEDVRKMIDFQQINLIGNWPPMVPMDLVFIRNVLIYFDVETKTSILRNIHKVMHPAGALFLGSTETLFHLDVPYERVALDKAAYYKPV